MKLGLLILMAWMTGCASIHSQRAATSAARPARLGAPSAATSDRAELQRPRPRPSDRHHGPIDLSPDARGARDRAAISPALRSAAPAHAGLAAGTLQPGEWPRTRWITLLTDVLSDGKLAHAAMWIGRQPLHVKVSGGGFSVAIRVATP